MALEKRNPIPIGVYWIDIISNNDFKVQNFEDWLDENSDKVLVLDSKKKAISSVSDHLWVLFEVTEPVERWPLEWKLGAPTIAKRGQETTIEDTVTRPNEVSIKEHWLGDNANIKIGIGAAVGVILLVLILKK